MGELIDYLLVSVFGNNKEKQFITIQFREYIMNMNWNLELYMIFTYDELVLYLYLSYQISLSVLDKRQVEEQQCHLSPAGLFVLFNTCDIWYWKEDLFILFPDDNFHKLKVLVVIL